MPRIHIATIHNTADPLVWKQVQIELVDKYPQVMAMQPGTCALLTKNEILLSGTREATEDRATILNRDGAHEWHESFDLALSMRNFVNWFRPKIWPGVPPICIKDGGLGLGKLLRSLLCKDVYNRPSGAVEAWRIDSSDYIRYGRWSDLTSTAYDGYARLDAANPHDLNKLRTALGFRAVAVDKPEVVSTLQGCVSPGLATFISNNPGDEMVLGFLLQETGMRLPVDVQSGGLEAITKWLIDATNLKLLKQFELFKAGEAKTAELPVVEKKPPGTRRIYYDEEQTVRGTASFYRVDHRRYFCDVPLEVISEAIAAGSHDPIKDYIIDDGRSEVAGEPVRGRPQFEDDAYGDIDETEIKQLQNEDGTQLVLQ